MIEKIKVLIVDDSRIFRSILEQVLKGHPGIDVIGSVRNGIKALEFLRTATPDLMTLDVEMDEMDGLETLKEVQKFNALKGTKIGAIMVSAHTKHGATITIDALQAGAFDFITKPVTNDPNQSIKILREELITKILEFKNPRKAKPSIIRRPIIQHPVRTISRPGKKIQYESILIGVSTGGPKALSELMPRLTKNIDLPIYIVQHMPPTFTGALAESLNSKCDYSVSEAGSELVAQKKHAYIAPGGKHMTVRRAGVQGIKMSLNDNPPEEGCKPSVNILFRSAAPVFNANTVAIILTGMGSDGTKGLRPLKRGGAYVIAQDERTSVVWGMPGSAVESGNVDEVLPLNQIAEAVEKLVLK